MDSRPGRTSSQISIYDYPEHLNPFYEDENHKRIRFWNIGKKKEKTNKTCRSNSFSLDGIRDIWTFKSFRSKKNGLRSSTLGINKTSESPPTLRRQIEPDSIYDTYSSSQRHTVGVGINNNNGNFQRNTGCRASLQDMCKVKEDSDLGFYRNNLYRSSMQGNTTMPTVRKRFDDRTSSAGMKSGSSQSSLNSTNPFDDEEDDNMSISSTVKRPARKKRRAPQPPVVIPKIITTSPPNELRISESTPTEEQSIELSNLTAEIESFVKTSDTETVTPIAKVENEIVTVNKPLVIIEVIEPPIEVKVEVKENIVEEVPRQPDPHVTATSEIDHPIVVKITETLEPSMAHPIIETLVLEESDGDELVEAKKIIEETNDKKTINTENYEFQIRYVPLKEGTPENDLNGSISSIPSNSSSRRRSVKDIIASINKSQSLLKINEPKENSSNSILNSSSVDKIAASSESLQKNIRELKENESKIQSFLQEMETKVDVNRNSYYDNIPSTVLNYEKTDELNNNNKKRDADIVFEKCVLRKKNVDENIDWNPVPKPRRSQRFSTDDNDIVGVLSVKK